MIARRNWYCLSCEKQQEDYQSKLSKHLVGSLPRQKMISKDEFLGGGVNFSTNAKNNQKVVEHSVAKRYESVSLVKSSSVAKMPKINQQI
jgi:hypothetical protein